MTPAKKDGDTKKAAKPPAPKPQSKPQQQSQPAEAPVIVGIGASAGGLKAFEQFFTSMPAEGDLNVAFALVQHLDPTHKSILTDLIKRYTKMKVFEVKDGVTVKANCAYIIPPNKDMAVLNGRLHLMEPEKVRGMRLPIDYFFRSLAQDAQERAICIVLAGTGTDGTLGLKAVKGAGGMVMVQTPESAQYDGMPRNAIGTGLVDYILPPHELAAQLLTYIQQAFGKSSIVAHPPVIQNYLQKIFVLLRTQTGNDFSYYKKNTIRRRIERRMVINQFEQIEAYVHYLQENPLEVDTLFKELLIGVTNFFRDPDAFEVLFEKGVAFLLDSKPANHPFRVWVPGCSTGEEAYTIAMLLREKLDELKKEFKIQVFATDIDAEAIAAARTGIYPESIAADVSAERLARFFYKEDNTYRIKKSIRDMVVFAEQNVIDDPPFSKMDIISCRNLLIYLESELQKRILPMFHYALNENGFLLLGNSESIGEFSDYFAVIDRKWKLFQRKGILMPRASVLDFKGVSDFNGPAATPEKPKEVSYNIREVTEQTLLSDYTPAGAVINGKGDVLYIHGRTGKYLEPASGQASLNILRMARAGLRLELSTVIRQVIAQNTTVRRPGLLVKENGNTNVVNLIVSPIKKPVVMQGLLLVVFEDLGPVKPPKPAPAGQTVGDQEQRIADLERELRAKEEHLQTTVEELETSNEELKSANEELQSTNEELQSTNEELETSKEELQSVNEELITVNTELQLKVDDLTRANNDMNNLLAGTGVGTIFVDHRLCIQRFTPAATQVVNLIQTDIGRPVGHISSNLTGYTTLPEDIRAVLDSLIPKEVSVQTKKGAWYILRIMPYRTLENVIEGAVVTFVDITEQRQIHDKLQETLRRAEQAQVQAEAIIDTVREPLIVLDAALRVVTASHAFYQKFEVDPDETVGRLLFDLGNKQWNIPKLRRLLEEILPTETTFNDFEVAHTFETIGRRTMYLNARRIHNEPDAEPLILLAIEDVTGRGA